MPKYQVVEKSGFAIDWAPVRYHAESLRHFDNEEDAVQAAKDYLTETNCNNALTKDEKQASCEAFMMHDDKCLLGVLEGADWYMTYPKDIVAKGGGVQHQKGDPVVDRTWFELDGKAEVSVRVVPGT